jgi:diacylglycerol kinase family enzyme
VPAAVTAPSAPPRGCSPTATSRWGCSPLGTTNNFARTAGVPLGLDEAVATLTGGKVIDVDLGLAGDMPFTNHVGVGLSADVMQTAPRPLKRVTGRLAYPITGPGAAHPAPAAARRWSGRTAASTSS